MIYQGKTLKQLKRFPDNHKMYQDGWELYKDQTLTDKQIQDFNKPILEAYHKESGLPDQYKYLIGL